VRRRASSGSTSLLCNPLSIRQQETRQYATRSAEHAKPIKQHIDEAQLFLVAIVEQDAQAAKLNVSGLPMAERGVMVAHSTILRWVSHICTRTQNIERPGGLVIAPEHSSEGFRSMISVALHGSRT
jgi:hypothetical protein